MEIEYNNNATRFDTNEDGDALALVQLKQMLDTPLRFSLNTNDPAAGQRWWGIHIKKIPINKNTGRSGPDFEKKTQQILITSKIE